MSDRSRPPFEPTRPPVLHSRYMGVFERAHERQMRAGETMAVSDDLITCDPCRRAIGLPVFHAFGAAERGNVIAAAADVIHETIIALAAERGYVFTHAESTTLAADSRRAAAELASRGMLHI